MFRTVRVIPGFLTVKGASELLGLATRSVRDLIYTGRLPSQRLGRLHYLRSADVDRERRRRLGLPVLAQPGRQARRAARGQAPAASAQPPASLVVHPRAKRRFASAAPRGARPVDTHSRRERAAQRAALVERWLRSGHRPAQPRLPFSVLASTAAAACGACGRRLEVGRPVVEAAAADGRPAGRLCFSCARRTMLNWADERRREATAARQLARTLGAGRPGSAPPSSAAA